MSAAEQTRTRTITWEDPVKTAQRAAGLSGLEYMGQVRDGEIPPPPIALLMGFEPVELSEGVAIFAVQPAEYHYNPIGVVHGGLALTLLDSALGCAVHTTLEAGTAYTSLEVKANFVRTITRDTGRVLAEGRVLHRGRKVATAEGRVFAQETGKLLAHGTTTCLIVPAPESA